LSFGGRNFCVCSVNHGVGGHVFIHRADVCIDSLSNNLPLLEFSMKKLIAALIASMFAVGAFAAETAASAPAAAATASAPAKAVKKVHKAKKAKKAAAAASAAASK
jgi:hypothetical protein